MLGGAILAGASLPVVLEACGSAGTPAPTIGATLQVDPASLEAGRPAELPFTLPASGGSPAVAGSAWLVKEADGTLVAFDPRCTHARCAYAWSAADGRFDCHCHRAAFDVEGKVLFGPPPRPLDRFEVRAAGGRIELEVPADFSTPRPEA